MNEASTVIDDGEHVPRRSRESHAVGVAIACSATGAIAKLAAGVLTGSMSLISSAVDSLGDLFISASNLVVIRYADQEPDEDHNYGHTRVEGLGALFEGGFVFAAGIFIVYEAIVRATQGQTTHDSSIGIAVMVPLLVLTVATVVHLRAVARATGSLVLKADAMHYLTDVWVNVGVLLSLALVKVTGLPLIDTVVSIGIALFMMVSSRGIIREGFDVLMERSLDPETVGKVRARLADRASALGVHDLKTCSGKIPHVDFHVVVDPQTTVEDMHALFLELRADVRAIVGPSTRVLVHADPRPVPRGAPA